MNLVRFDPYFKSGSVSLKGIVEQTWGDFILENNLQKDDDYKLVITNKYSHFIKH